MKEYTLRQSAVKSADIYMRLLTLLTTRKRFLAPDVTAAKLAEELNCSPRNISMALQSSTGRNFSHLLNDLRLREVCRRLTSPRYASSTVEDIGLACGYKTRQAFYIAFQRHLGTTPSLWREQNTQH